MKSSKTEQPDAPATEDSQPEPTPNPKSVSDPHLLAHHAATAAEKAVIASQSSPGLGSSVPTSPRK